MYLRVHEFLAVPGRRYSTSGSTTFSKNRIVVADGVVASLRPARQQDQVHMRKGTRPAAHHLPKRNHHLPLRGDCPCSKHRTPLTVRIDFDWTVASDLPFLSPLKYLTHGILVKLRPQNAWVMVIVIGC